MYGKLLVVGGCLIATLTACLSHSFVLAAPQATETATSHVDSIQMKTYTEPGGAFKFDYPKDWQEATDYYYGGPPNCTESLFEDKYGAKCNVTFRENVKNANHPDSESVLHLLTDLPDKSNDLKRLSLKVDGTEMYEHVYKYQQFKRTKFSSPVYAIFDFVILKNNNAYILTTKCFFQCYEEYLPIFERMGKSFRVK